jgi:hypothetical protein
MRNSVLVQELLEERCSLSPVKQGKNYRKINKLL